MSSTILGRGRHTCSAQKALLNCVQLKEQVKKVFSVVQLGQLHRHIKIIQTISSLELNGFISWRKRFPGVKSKSTCVIRSVLVGFIPSLT